MEDFKSEKLIFNAPKTVNDYFVNIDSEIMEPENYREIYERLIIAEPTDTFIFLINSIGGDVSTAMQLHSTMLITPASTRAIVINAHSAASIIALSCDSILVEDCGALMIHSPRTWINGSRPQGLDAYSKYFYKSTTTWFQKIYQGFLTPEEISKVILGMDMWINKKEADKRLKKWTPIRKRK